MSEDPQPSGRPPDASASAVALESPFRTGFLAAMGAAVALLLVRMILAAAPVMLLVGIALFFALGLDPAVNWLQRRGLGRGWAVFSIAASVVVVLVVFLAAAAPPLLTQADDLRTEVPDYLDRLTGDNDVVRQLDDRFDVIDRLRDFVSGESTGGEAADGRGGEETQPALGGAFGDVLGMARGVLAAFASTLTVVVLALYLLASLAHIKATAYRLVPRSKRERVVPLADQALDHIGAYLLGNLATSAIAASAAFVFFVLVGIPYPFPLAVVIAFTGLIPLVGATIGSTVAVVVGFFVSVPVGIATLAFSFVYQQIENYVLVPRIMKRTLDVSPLATIVAALIGAALLGIFGALLAVPVAASIQIVGREVLLPRQEAT